MPKTNSKPVVLLLSQSQQSRRSIAKILDPNFAVIAVEDAESAWEALVENSKILVLISELALVIDDFDLLERIRNANENRLAASPVLLLVGENDNDDDRETAFRNGATDFINMPFVSNELITRVRLHTQLFVQHVDSHAIIAESVAAANVLQQLSQENIFLSRLEQELAFSYRHKTSVSACKLKLDNLKAIVAGFDKSTAGAVVQAVAKILQQSVRSEDTLCYLGRAEFCIIFPATNGIGAAICVNRIQKKIMACKIQAGGKRVPVSLSGAIYTDIAESDTNTETVLKILQTRLQEAIAQGGNRIISTAQESEKAHVSVDQALRLIARENTDSLKPVAQDLMLDILPLLEFSDSVLKLGMKSVTQSLREKLK
jgi:two-component system cell cycle response regulator